MPHLSIRALGPLVITLDGQAITSLAYDKVWALLVYLACAPDQLHKREALAGLLWPDQPEEKARTNLRQALARLRKAIGDAEATPSFLHSDHTSIQFNPAGAARVDVAEFTGLLAACAAHTHRHAETCTACAERRARAAALYRGGFLERFSIGDSDLFEEWATLVREGLHQQALDALAALVTYHERRGNYRRALQYGERQLELEPWREEAYRQVMRILALNGQRSDALHRYARCRTVLAAELGVPPSAETTALYEQIRAAELDGALKPDYLALPTTRPHNLPLPPTPFFGREQELATLADLITNPHCRLITLLGPGGTGKTRLALQVASDEGESFADGTIYVSLAPLTDADLIVPTVAAALNFKLARHAAPLTELLHYLRQKDLLLVLDNFEHLLTPPSAAPAATGSVSATELLSAILRHAPGVTLLVTSRERLNIQGEWTFAVAGLEMPPQPERSGGEQPAAFDAYPAVALFLQTARRVQQDFTQTPADRTAIGQICRLVQGMPLALELAAAWVRVLSCREIAHEITQSLGFLTAPLRDLPERHRSLQAVFDHSWKLLSAEEQQVFMACSVFRGGFTREAAAEVAGASLATLAALVDKSLLRRNLDGRYEVHELLRQYGLQHLQLTGDLDYPHDRHSRYFLLSLGKAEDDLKGRRQMAALGEIEAELDDFRAAWAWALARADYAVLKSGVEAFHLFFALRGRNYEGGGLLWHAYQFLETVRDTPTADLLRRRVLVRYALVRAQVSAEEHLVDPDLAHALTLASADGDQAEVAACWYALGRSEVFAAHARQRPDFELARRYLEQAQTCFEAVHGYFYMARIARLLAGSYGYDAAGMQQHQAYHIAGLEYARRAGSVVDQVISLGSLGWCAIDLGMVAEAERYFDEATALSREPHFQHSTALVTLGLAYVRFCQGDMHAAQRLAEEGLAVARALNSTERESVALLLLSLVAILAGDVAHGLHLVEQSLQIGTGRYYRTYIDWTLALAHGSLCNAEMAWGYLQAAHCLIQVPASISRVLAVAAVLLGLQGERQRAAELLGAIDSDRAAAHGWMEQWQPLTDLRAALRSELGTAVYQSLWKRGSGLDAAALADALLGRAA